MNKISMSKTCLYNFSYKKLPDIYNNQSLRRAFSYSSAYNTNFATVHSRVTVGGCSVEYEYNLLLQFARVVAHRMYTSVLSICTILLQGHTKFFQFAVVCFQSLSVPVFRIFSSLSAIAAQFCSEIRAKTLRVALQ